jgi:hypothetical protein
VKLDWGPWFYGLLAAGIGGGAGAVAAGFAAPVIAPGQFGVGGNPGWNSLKLMGAVFIVSGALSVAFFLKQSPLPARILTVTKTEDISLTKKDS